MLGCSAGPKARLHYAGHQDAAGCLSPKGLRAAVNKLLGYKPWDGQATRRIRLNIEREGDQLVGHVRVMEGGRIGGMRSLRAKPNQCAELSRALAITISLAVDPLRAVQQSRRPHPTQRTRWLGEFGTALALGSTPKPSVAVSLGLSRRKPHSFSLGAELEAHAPTKASIDAAGVTSWRVGGRALACYHLRWALACPTLALFAQMAHAHGLQPNRFRATAVPELGLRLAANWPLSEDLGLTIGGLLSVPLLHVRLTDDLRRRQFWRSPPVNLLLGLRLDAGLF